MSITVSFSLTSSYPIIPRYFLEIKPRQGTSSAITAPSVRSGRFRMRAPLSRGPQRSRLLDLNIPSDTLAITNPHISKYSQFSL